MLLRLFEPLLRAHNHWDFQRSADESLTLHLKPLAERFAEEERSKQPSPFSLVRLLVQEFRNAADSRLMLTGAFGYDLLLQFDPIQQHLPRHDEEDAAPLPLRRHLLHGSQERIDRALSIRFQRRSWVRLPGLIV